MSEILKATLLDIDDLVSMGHDFFHEAGLLDIASWSNEQAATAFKELIESPNAIVLVVKKDGVNIGAAGGVFFPLWFNHNVKMAQEFFLYVKEGERGGVGGILLKTLEDKCRENGVDSLAMLSLEKLPSLDRLYARHGYRPSEKTFIKRL